MKILKYLLFLILIILIGGSIFFGTKEGTYDYSEKKVIAAPPEVVYTLINDFKSWEEWGPWMELDPDMKISYADHTAGEGASYSWESDNEEVGKGSMQTLKVVPFEQIDQKIIFNTPAGDSGSDVYWLFEETETQGQTKVTWGMKGEYTFMEKVFISLQGEDMEVGMNEMLLSGLSNIEVLVKEKMEAFSVQVDGVTQYGGGYYLYTTTSSRTDEIGEKMGPMFGTIMSFMEENKLNPSGMPFTIYNEIDEMNGTVIFSACIPVKERIITLKGSPILCGYMQPATVLKTTLKGNYDYLGLAYVKANEYIQEKQLQRNLSAKMFEVYINDPGKFPNPADWITEVYIPVINSVK